MTEQPKKLTKAEILSALKADMKAADSLRLDIVTSVEKWRREYDGKPYGNEQKGKSEFVSRDIKRQDEWQHASVKDPFVSTPDIIKCHPITFEDVKAAEQNELVLNYQFTRQFNRYRFMTDIIKLFYKEGTVVVKTSWVYEDEVEEVQKPIYSLNLATGQPEQTGSVPVKNIKVLTNRPDAEICRLEDIYFDPTCKGNLDNAQFVIHRYETDLSSLRKSGKYKQKELKQLAKQVAGIDIDDFEEEDDTNFMFGDNARKKFVLYEYWGNFDIDNDGIAEPIVCAWVENVLLLLQSNPFPDQKIPFVVGSNNSTPFKLHGEANAELIGDNQKLTTAVKRGIIDNMANSNNTQKGIPTGMLNALNKKRFLNGKNFEFNGTASNLFEGSYNQIPGSVFNVMDMVNNDSESMLGVKSFSGGIDGGGLGSTAKAAGGVLDATSVRRLDIVRNLAENVVKPIMRKWTSYNSEFLNENEVIRITNAEFVEIKRDDLSGNIDIQIEVSTAEDDANKAKGIAFWLQTLGQQLPPGMMQLLMAKMAKLDKMPDLASALENYEPQPDPYVEEMKQLEKMKLMAEIKERESRATENAADIRIKNANAGLAEARARHLGSDADLKDLEFTKKATGEDLAERITEKDHDRNSELMKQSQAAKNKD